MSNLNDGEVQIVLGDETVTLEPTIEAVKSLSRLYGGLQGALKACSNQDIEAQAAIVQIGANIEDKADIKMLPLRIFKAGMLKTTPLLNDYILMLMNGGKPLVEQSDSGNDAGNSPG
ncbi:MAG TPA: hypothetical protein VM659_28545 [Dongiaceae bacterium]|nr:hypothetical protein [Dongiaceae bacterium]